jgi:hypothetical protein
MSQPQNTVLFTFQTPIPVQSVQKRLTTNMQRNTTDRVKPTFQAVDGLFRIGLEISLVTSAAVLPPVTSLSLINESCIISYLYWGLNGFSITDFGEVSH